MKRRTKRNMEHKPLCDLCSNPFHANGLCKKHYGIAYRASHQDVVKIYREREKAKIQAHQLEWQIAHRKELAIYHASYNTKLRTEVLSIYGNKCKCCGESEPQFLTLEHENHDGAEHRKRLGSRGVYIELRNLGVPKEGFSLLCWNCNCATKKGQICPHQLKSGR